MSLAERLAQRMREKGDRYVMDASKRTGVAYATLHPITTGDVVNPSRVTLQKIADGYGVTVDWLLTGDPAGVLVPAAPADIERIEGLLEEALGALRDLRVRYTTPADGGGVRRPSSEEVELEIDHLRRDGQDRASGEE